jgi:HAMP domain-containing protein
MRSPYILLTVVLVAAVFGLTPAVQAQSVATPTPVLASNSTPLATPTLAPGVVATSVTTSPAPSDQIASVALQVAQVANDPTMTVDVKTQQINALALQFNQLVLVWQQQVAAIQTANPASTPVLSGSTGAVSPGVGSTPTPFGFGSRIASAVPTTSGTPTPASTTPGSSATPGLLASGNVDQIRGQIAAVSQKMTTVSNDPTLPAAIKAKQLQDLGTQFNQLVQQLRQLGG